VRLGAQKENESPMGLMAVSRGRYSTGRRWGSGRAWGRVGARAWLFFLPLLFLPNLGYSRDTAFGALEMSDYLVVPYLALLLAGKGRAYPSCSEGLRHVLVAFLAWAFLGTVSINLRYDYGQNYDALYYALLKLAKLALYGFAGLLTISRVQGGLRHREFHWSLLAVIAVLGTGLLVGPGKDANIQEALLGYKAINPVSVTAAVLVGYCSGLLASGYGSGRWKRAATATLVLGLAGIFVSGARGGWLAAALTAPYLVWRRGVSRASVGLVVGFLIVGYVGYRVFPTFQQKFDFTVTPELRYETGEVASIKGIDEGGRWESWSWEVSKLTNAPFWGTGFYHRGALSGLNSNGSHNFFLQMFLETGLVGGCLVLIAFRRMWLDAGSRGAQQALLTTPLRAALIAAVVGGMGGEYFYGGFPLLALFLVYAPTGSLPKVRRPHTVRFVSRIDGRLVVKERRA